MNVLVTGGAGYIGSHACKELSRAGHKPIVVDDLVYGHRWAVKWGPLYVERIQNTDKIIEILLKEKIEAVVHFAAFAYVGESCQNPLKYYENNVAGTLSLLNAMAKAEVYNIVFSSSCATYGIPKKLPITEESEQLPINPYGRTKLVCENILSDYCRFNKFKAIALRYFNAAGADLECDIGEDHEPETHLIPLAIEACYNPQKTMSIFGNDYPTVDGTCVRDYIHVTDLARAHVIALVKLCSMNEKFDVYNLGTGSGISVKEIIAKASQVTGRSPVVEIAGRRDGDPHSLVASPAKANRALNWYPQHSDLSTIIESAHKWYLHHHLREG